MKFRVLGGAYILQTTNPTRVGEIPQRKEYKAGDIVESDIDLCERYQNKFERVKDDEQPAPANESLKERAERLRKLADEAAAEVAAMSLDEPEPVAVEAPATQVSTPAAKEAPRRKGAGVVPR